MSAPALSPELHRRIVLVRYLLRWRQVDGPDPAGWCELAQLRALYQQREWSAEALELDLRVCGAAGEVEYHTPRRGVRRWRATTRVERSHGGER